ncbi:MAG: N-acetylneuraminate synthase [Chloroflexi bacterium RBG_19FT_COMBO_47_15]|nr:MAG: N-acetylneuraminate synthase [Chloroflexi bacterium RBG_19FT_COMBO_47_15]
MSKRIRIGGRVVGENAPCFIIAEAGVNHNGDVNLAKRLVDVAMKAGADAVKFQSFKAENVVTRKAATAKYQAQTTGSAESQYEMIKKLELSAGNFVGLAHYAQKKGILFLSTPFDKDSVDLLDGLGVPAFKIASGEITNFPLIRYIAEKGKPVILSTGMSTLGEINEALQVIQSEGIKDIVLLHCTTAYPAKVEDVNLKAMETLRREFKVPVGLSDHTLGITIPIAAVALGACVIEKHFTLDKSLPGPDHQASLEPKELKQMNETIREVEKAMGDGNKMPTEEERQIQKAVRRSIVARVNIPKGTIITEAMLDIKRPGTGLEPKYMDKVIGAVARYRIQQDEPLTMNKLEVRR